jgi:hypothetical protein
MNNVRELLRPTKLDWAGLPRRGSAVRATFIAWLAGAGTVAGAFVADRGWEAAPPPSPDAALLPLEVAVIAATLASVYFAAFGWTLGRRAAFASLGVFTACTVLHAIGGSASTPVWAVGALVGWLLAAREVTSSLGQLRKIRSLAARLRDGTTVHVGTKALAAERRALIRGRGVMASFAGVSLLLWAAFMVQLANGGGRITLAPETIFAPSTASVAAVATLLTVLWAVRYGWRWWAHRQFSGTVWQIPGSEGPVWTANLIRSYGEGLTRKDSQTPGCICLEEAERHDIDDGPEWTAGTISADDYCPAHGIDAVNALDHGAFRNLARAAWLWDADSALPQSEADTPYSGAALLAFAGHAFRGIPVFNEANDVDSVSPLVEPALELTREGRGGPPQWVEPDSVPPAERGIMDVIDLAPVGLPGAAARYRHGRAWHRP